MTSKQQFRILLTDLVTLVVATVPGLLLSLYSLQEPWALYRIARAVASVKFGFIPTYSNSASAYHAEHLGSEIFASALYSSSSWNPHWLALLPIGSLFSVLIYFSIAETISASRFNAVALALYIGWYYPRLYSQYAVQTYAWTNNLFIGFLILFYYWLKERRQIYSILIFIIFVVNFFFYQTTPVWMITIMIFSILALKFRERTPVNITWAIPLFMVVFYLTFDTIFYHNYLAHMRSETTNEALYQNFFSKIIIPLLQRTDQKLAPFVVSPVNPPLATYLTLISLLLMVLPVGYWVVQKIILTLRQRNLQLAIGSEEDIFIWAVLIVNFVHMFIYLGYGAVSTRVIPLVFPILLLLVVKQTKIQHYLLSGLALVSILGFVSFISEFKPDQQVEELGISGQLIRHSSTVLADANVFALLQLQSIQSQKLVDFAWVTPEEYTALVSGMDVTKYPVDYWVIDKSGKPVVTFGWIFMEPWMQHYDEIEKNPYLNKIYDSEKLAVFQPIRSSLPEHIPDWRSGLLYRSFPVDTIAILVTVLATLLFPGFTLMLVVKHAMRISHFISFCGVSSILSLCVVIILGYLLNFLSWLNVLPIAIIFVISSINILVLWIYRRRLSVKLFNSSLGISLILMLVFVCYWALAATSVAHARTAITKGFTEFYITQAVLDDQRETVQVNITNNSKSENTYQLTILQENVKREYSFTLEPGNTQIYQFLKNYFLSKNGTVLVLVDTNEKRNVLTIRE